MGGARDGLPLMESIPRSIYREKSDIEILTGLQVGNRVNFVARHATGVGDSVGIMESVPRPIHCPQPVIGILSRLRLRVVEKFVAHHATSIGHSAVKWLALVNKYNGLSNAGRVESYEILHNREQRG